MAQAPQGLGEAVGVGGVKAGIQAGVVVQQAVEDPGRLARGAGDDLGGEDAEAVADVGVDGDRLVVVAEVAGMVGADQRARRGAEALAVRGGQSAVSPGRGEINLVEMLDDPGAGRLHRGLPHQPARGLLEVGRRQALDAVAHGGQAEVGAVGDQGGQQGAVGVPGARLVAGERPEGAGEAAAPVDVEQDVLDAHPRHPAFDLPAQAAHLRRHGQGIGTAQAQLPLLDGGEVVGRQAGGERAGGLFDGSRQVGEVVGRPVGQAEVGVGGGAGGGPQRLVEHQRPEAGITPAAGQVQVAGAQGVADRQGQRRLPHRAAQPAAVVAQHRPPAGRDEAGRRVLGQDLDLATVEPADQINGLRQVVVSGVGGERQGQEGRQRLAQIG